MLLYDTADKNRLNDASHIITTGSLPIWMSEKERHRLLQDVLPACQKAGMARNCHEQLVFLSQQVQENIHAVVCPRSAANSLRCFYQDFPGEI